MAGGITVTPEQLREISTQMNAGAADVEAVLSRLAGVVAPLRSEWVGTAQAQFETLWDQWQRDATGLHSALTGVVQLTQNAATSYESTEQSVATSFNQG